MIGQRFGNYRALSLLGEGGMGAVYLAEHPEIGRRVAIKVLRPELIKEPQLLLRFLNEARAANAIRHPNIIEILDSGTTPEGTPYLVMELLEGEVLSARIRRLGKLSLGDAMEFSYQAASALAAAHGKGIIHRDLKPDNLFIIPDPVAGGRERMKVLDFGIAKLQTVPSGGGMMTRTGTLMGTPVYMSPEQCLGTRAIDQRSDVYAMGIIMYEMLTGHPPFVSEGFGELVNMHLNVRPRPLREVQPDVPEAVSALVEKALEKSPEARQRSAAELQLDIRSAAGRTLPIRGVSSSGLVGATMASAQPDTIPGPPRAPTPELAPHPLAGPTTLSTGTGERYPTTVPMKTAAGGRGRKPLLAGGMLVAAAGLVVAVVAGLRSGRPDRVKPDVTTTAAEAPSTSAAAGAAPGAAELAGLARPEPTVRVTIASVPAGAVVTDADSGRSLGSTPVLVERQSGQGPVTARLEKAGYAPVTRVFALDRDGVETVPLPRLAAEPAGGGGKSPAGKSRGAARSKKRSRPQHQPGGPSQTHADEEPAKL